MKKAAVVVSLLLVFTVLMAINYQAIFFYFSDLLLEDTINLLLVGIDAASEDGIRTDTLMVLNIDIRELKINLLSIPRDTMIDLPGQEGYDKINDAYSQAGIDLTKQVIEEKIGICIDYYLEVNYDGFVGVVETLGGVELEVEERMDYVDKAGGLNIDLEPGIQTLNGEEALDYARFRDRYTGDIGRIKRQQKLIQAGMEQFLVLETASKVPDLIGQAKEHLKTDLGFFKSLGLGFRLQNLDLDRVETALLPGEADYIDGVSYWVPDWSQVKEVVDPIS